MNVQLDYWKILIFEKDMPSETVADRIDEIVEYLANNYSIETFTTFTSNDFFDVFYNTNNLAAIMIEYHEETNEKFAKKLAKIREFNPYIPVIGYSRERTIDSLCELEFNELTDFYYIPADTVDFLAERMMNHAKHYVDQVLPIFVGGLIEYTQKEKYAWHTPGHMGGTAFRKDATGQFFYDYLGENAFRSDLSISVPDLGSLLDHEGVVGDQERESSKVFNSDLTYYVLNGTSSVNQIVWRGRVTKDDLSMVDRNCHKSLNYAMVVSEAIPSYMIPRRNAIGIIGPVKLSEFTKEAMQKRKADNPLIGDKRAAEEVKMSALTNSTYDGLCYNVNKIKKELATDVQNMHFDEAWYAYAKFHPIYKNHFAMTDDNEEGMVYPPIFASQSTHKLLAAFSQGSMLHAKNGTDKKIDPEIFNEAYMMYGSTSPNYGIIASLATSSKMMELNGYRLINDTLKQAVDLRKDITKLYKKAKNENDWFFHIWQPESVIVNGSKIPFEEVETDYLVENQGCWVLDPKNNWHGFNDIEEDYVMLDPMKVTIRTPGLTVDGRFEENGIPASILTNYLINKGIVCEKTDYYSFLMLHSMGTTKGKQGALLIELAHFKELYDRNAPMVEVFPDLCAQYPGFYDNQGLKDHCDLMHKRTQELDLLGKLDKAFEIIPTPVVRPAEAARKVFREEVKKVTVHELMNQVGAVMIVPYPPGIPILMGGEKVDQSSAPIADYLIAREAFEQEFPGYFAEIHGIDAVEKEGKRVFTTMVFA